MITPITAKTVISVPTFTPIVFDIPDSIDGSKREATFNELKYYNGDNLVTPEAKETCAYLEVSFFVRKYVNITIQDPSYYDNNILIVPPPRIEKHELIGRGYIDKFRADYKTLVNVYNAGEIILLPKNKELDLQGLADYLNDLVSNNVYTEQEILDNDMSGHLIVSQVKYFEMMFHNANNNGLIPVKDMIESFAQNANWKDIKTNIIS